VCCHETPDQSAPPFPYDTRLAWPLAFAFISESLAPSFGLGRYESPIEVDGDEDEDEDS
jgi:hypothetical protein